jgi:hypothetical protein
MMVRKYIQSTLEEKLSTSDIGVQWCSAKIVLDPVPHSTAQLSAAIASRLLTTSSWVKGDVHMLLPGDQLQLHCVVIGLSFSLFFGWGWRLFGDWQRGW